MRAAFLLELVVAPGERAAGAALLRASAAVARVEGAVLQSALLPGRGPSRDALRRAASQALTQDGTMDTLPALLLSLILDAGLRLGEVERLGIDDVDLSDPLRPAIRIRYEERRHRAKRRRVVAPPELTNLVQAYLEQHPPDEGQTALLSWSRRHLQYTIQHLGEAAGLKEKLTANTLRWTYTAREWRNGASPEQMRARLGLSELGWRDVEAKLAQVGGR